MGPATTATSAGPSVRAFLQPAGSAPWWRARTVALATSMDRTSTARKAASWPIPPGPDYTRTSGRMLGRQWMVLAAARTQIESGEPQAR